MTTAEALSDKCEVEMIASFARFKESQTVRLLMSMVPSGDRPEVLETLLKEAHDRGFAAGVSTAMIQILSFKPPADR